MVIFRNAYQIRNHGYQKKYLSETLREFCSFAIFLLLCFKKYEIFICGTVTFAKLFGEATWQSKQCEIVAGVPETESKSFDS